MTNPKYKPSIKPLTIYYYGDGKGKTTAALGVALRAAGHGWKVLILQALKGSWPSGERVAIPKYINRSITIKTVGKGFVGIVDDKLPRREHKKAAKDAITLAKKMIASKKWDLVILDEYGDLPSLELISTADLIGAIGSHRKKTDVIITGHKPIKGLINSCDLVTRMKSVKHPFKSGIMARKGIDF